MAVILNIWNKVEIGVNYFMEGQIRQFKFSHIVIDKLLFREWCQLGAWQNVRGCTFYLTGGDGGARDYQFCRGASACQLVNTLYLCDGVYDCFDR